MTTLDALAASGVVTTDVVLGSLTTYKFGGPARWLADVPDTATLVTVLDARRESGNPDTLVLGRGSNLLIADAGFDGLVIRLSGAFLEITIDDEGVVAAGGAVPLPMLARATAKAGRGGLEWFVGIPGSVGGAVCMNAGGHGSDTSEWIIDAAVMSIATGEAQRRDALALELGYRRSAVGTDEIVLDARFRTVPRAVTDAERRLREITQWRREHQPGGTYNAGSVFKNPPGDAAGRLIDMLGLKGFRIGGAAVSAKHANFFEAGEGATAQDVYDLVGAVRAKVRAATGIELVPEIRFAGSFRSLPDGPGGNR